MSNTPIGTIKSERIICPSCGVKYKLPTNRSLKFPVNIKCKKCSVPFAVNEPENSHPNESLKTMEYSDIIKDITSKLTGDSKKDCVYLQAEVRKYKDHEYSGEITRAVGRLMFQIIPDDKKGEWAGAFANMRLSSDTILDEIQLKIHKGDLDQAEQLLKCILPVSGLFKEDKSSIYFAFNNPIEEIYYKSKFNQQKKIRIADIDTEIFHTYAYILIEKKRFAEAMTMLSRGLDYNPIDTKLLFEIGEILKIHKDWDAFKRITDLCARYSYNSGNIARVYRNYGFMFIELKEYDVATCCYSMSLTYESSEMAQSQLYYISQLTGSKLKPEDYLDEIDELFDAKGIQMGANPELLQIAFNLGKQHEEDHRLNDAYSFYSIVYDLTGNEEIKEKLIALDRRGLDRRGRAESAD